MSPYCKCQHRNVRNIGKSAHSHQNINNNSTIEPNDSDVKEIGEKKESWRKNDYRNDQ
jgi:hypothetical protein